MAFKDSISFATDLAAIFGCNQFRIMPDTASKLLRTAVWSSCAVQFESEQAPWTGHQFRSAAVHRIQFGTCCFIPMSYFYMTLSCGIALWSDCQSTGRAWTWTQTWTLPPDHLVVKVLSALKSQNKLCGVWILVRSVENAKIEDSSELISTLIHQTACIRTNMYAKIRSKIRLNTPHTYLYW